jgi:predicted permease
VLRLRAILFRRALDDDMQAEMREHLDRATERYVARGMAYADARLAAKREFGNVTVLQEQARDTRGARWVEAVAGDMHFAVRYFARHKGITTIILTVIALATGANMMMFSIFQAEFLRAAPAVPVDHAHARIWGQERATRTDQWQPRGFTQPELVALAERREIFRDIAAWADDEVVLDGSDSTGARGVRAQFVTPNFFAVLGVRLSAGIGFRADGGDSPGLAVVMSHKTAERRYGSAAAAVGRRILVNEIPAYVVGVAPPRFQGAVRDMNEPSLWLPLSVRAAVARISPRWLIDEPALSLFARLNATVRREQATAFARHVVTSALPDSATRVGMARTADVLGLNSVPPGAAANEAILMFTIVTGIGMLILLVGWMNVSSLMVAAAVGRRHEIAVRLSLGATRARLLRQLVTESTVLAIVGSAIGLTLAWWFLTWSQKKEIDGVTITPDLGTFAFVLVMALATGILFGLSPALHATRGGVSNALRDSGTGTSGRSRLQRGFVIAQIALSQPLLVLLGTMLSMAIAEYQPTSLEMSRRVIAIELHPLTGKGAPSQRGEAVDSLVPRIATRPEVLSAVQDASGFDIRGIVAPDRRPNAARDTVPTIVHVEGAAPGWFTLRDIPIVLGRDVSFADTTADSYPVVIGSDLARALWDEANPVGRRLPSPVLRGLAQDSIMMTVVGVYDATRQSPRMTWNGGTARGDIAFRVYTAHGQHWRRDRILVRTHGPAASFVPELQRFVRTQAPSLPVTSMLTLAQIDQRDYRETARTTALVGAGGLIALLLASLGLYGVVSLAVRQRTREIGIRIAVGAHPMRVARMFLVSGVRASVVALGIGLPLSVVGLKVGLSQGILIAPQASPILIGVVIAILLVAVAAAATWVPARRAALVDPARTLRVE